MSYLYYTKGVMLFIKNDNKCEDFSCIEISKEQEKEILNKKNNGYFVKVINNEVVFIEDLAIKREKIVNERNKLIDVAGRYIDRPTYTNKLGLTSEDLEDAEEYYNRLLDMPQHFDSSDDKQAWDFVFVESYTSGKNTNKYQLFKPAFIK